jgi:AcrR family transcriptional regulator
MNVKDQVEAPRGRKAEQSDATRAALMKAARQLFAKRGYSKVSTEEIVKKAGVTRGALYHHFAGKQDLFRAVFEQVEGELTQKIAERALSGPDPLAALQHGADMFLEAASDPEVQRITLLDAPAVLGWGEWRELGMKYGLGLIQAALQAAMDAKKIDVQPVQPLSHLLLGALDEAAMYIARAEDEDTAREEVAAATARILASLTAAR